MTTRPVLTVEIAFDSSAIAWNPSSWTDVTAYVRDIAIRRGRTDEIEDFTAGTCTLTFDNRDRRFDPLNTASPYNGKLLSRRQIRVKATWAGTTYTLFRGNVSGWGVSPDVSGDSVWQVEAYDWLAYLAGVTLPASLLAYYVVGLTSPDITTYLPLGTSDQVCLDQVGSNDYTHTISDPKTGEDVGPFLGGGSQQYDGTYGTIGPVIDSAGAWTVSFWFKTDVPGPAGGLNPILAGAGPDPVTIGIDEYGRLAYRRGSGNTAHSGFSAIDPSIWHNGTIGYDGSGVVQIWVDGLLLSAGNATGTGTDGTGFQLIGFSTNPVDSTYFTGNLAHIIFYSDTTYVTQTELFAKQTHAAGMQGRFIFDSTDSYAGYTTCQLAGYISNVAGIDPTLTDQDDGEIIPMGITLGGTALQAIQQLAYTERGRTFVNGLGRLQIQGSNHDYTSTNSTTVQSIFTDADLSVTPHSAPFSAVSAIQYNDAHLVNQAEVTIGSGSGYTASDSTSQATYGIRRQTYDTWLGSQDQARTYGDIVISQYSEPQLRIESWTVNPYTSASYAFPEILTREISDRVRLDLFTDEAYPISQEMLIEQIEHQITPETWLTTYSGSPAVHAWLLEDATYGLLEDTTILG